MKQQESYICLENVCVPNHHPLYWAPPVSKAVSVLKGIHACKMFYHCSGNYPKRKEKKKEKESTEIQKGQHFKLEGNN